MKKVCLGGYGKLKYELYEDGTVVSVGHISSRGYEVQDKILTYSMRNGYKCVTMNLDGKSKYYYLYRLLAQNVIENPNSYPRVNHIDGKKSITRYQTWNGAPILKTINTPLRQA